MPLWRAATILTSFFASPSLTASLELEESDFEEFDKAISLASIFIKIIGLKQINLHRRHRRFLAAGFRSNGPAVP